MLGIIIGVAVVAMVAIGSGARERVAAQIRVAWEQISLSSIRAHIDQCRCKLSKGRCATFCQRGRCSGD